MELAISRPYLTTRIDKARVGWINIQKRKSRSGSLFQWPKPESSELLSIEGREVRVTNPDKLYFSQARITKLDLVRYYLSVAPGALAGIQDRPIVLKRFVNGAEAQRFIKSARRSSDRIGCEP